MPLDTLFGPPVRIQPYFGYRSRTRLIVTARALRARERDFAKSGRLQAMRTLASQFASREEAGIAVTLEVAGPDGLLVRHEGLTDGEGFVRFDLVLEPEWDLPPDPVWETAALRWANREGPQCVEAHILVPGRKARLAVISDIDDTVIETGITGGMRTVLRNWKRILAELPEERIAAPGADTFYGALGGGHTLPPGEIRAGKRIPATHRPFFYVSSSPWNLFSYLVAFMQAKNLPLGPLMLRDWGFNRATFGSASHGGHKTDTIAHLLEMFDTVRFALIGDDTQGDLPAYAEAIEKHPGRVAAVFIRTSAGETLSGPELTAKALIEASGVPLWMGASYEIGQDFLRVVGFTPGGETEQIVSTTKEKA
ncbi:phosphatase domain-containing protein [Tsuneonella sp. HG222]